jgi:transposase InsO family protein
MKKGKNTQAHLLDRVKNDYYSLSQPEGFSGSRKIIKKYPNKLTREWLSTQPTYSLHRPLRHRYPTRSYRTNGLDDIWQIDLLEMIQMIRKGFKYILTVIDIFSKYAFALPVRTKTGLEISKALTKLLTNNRGKQRRPRKIQADQGKEFYNKSVSLVLQKYSIHLYSVYSKYKCALVERFNRTLRSKLNRYFTYTGRKVWYDKLQCIIDTYNNTPHSALFKHTPASVNRLNEADLWLKMYSNNNNNNNSISTKSLLQIGKFCRIAREKSVLKKNFSQNWSDEVFVIVGIDTKHLPTMYILQDLHGETIRGKFYKQELQIIAHKPRVYRVEKILKTKGKGATKQYYVKWHGIGSSENSWISASNMVENYAE